MDRLPFTVYDFFACLSAGLVTLVGIAAAFTGSTSWQQNPSTIVTLVLVIATYSTGHVVANVAGHLLERLAVGRLLGTPTAHLLSEQGATGWRRVLFPGYVRPLPAALRSRVAARVEQAGHAEAAGETLFLIAFSAVKTDSQTYSRLSTFLNLYGFCRNVCIAALVAAACLVAGSTLDTAHTGTLVAPGWWAVGCVTVAIGLFYRYLKFFRQYAAEVFVTYATLPR